MKKLYVDIPFGTPVQRQTDRLIRIQNKTESVSYERSHESLQWHLRYRWLSNIPYA